MHGSIMMEKESLLLCFIYFMDLPLLNHMVLEYNILTYFKEGELCTANTIGLKGDHKWSIQI